MDNLNTHTPSSFYEAFEPEEAWRLAQKVEVHYTPTGQATTDRTSVGLVFADGPVEHEGNTLSIPNKWIQIPPGAPNHAVAQIFRKG